MRTGVDVRALPARPRAHSWQPNIARRKAWGTIAQSGFLLGTMGTVALLVMLLTVLVWRGRDWLSWGLITDMPSTIAADRAGMNSAIVGSFYLVIGASLFSMVVGVSTAVLLEEYVPPGRLKRVLQTNISNLAGVPSVVYGLLGLALFVNILQMGRVLLAGALTMGLLILPIVIIASQEAIRSVPLGLRQAAYALGATQWQTVRHHVLPAAMPGILTGTILSLSRAIGETAPLIVVGASPFLLFRPDGLFSSYSAMPMQIYSWTRSSKHEFQDLAAAAIIVLMVVLLGMNAIAILIRQRMSRGNRW